MKNERMSVSGVGAGSLLTVLAVLCLVAIIPAIVVLKQRFKEIEGGELDAAAD